MIWYQWFALIAFALCVITLGSNLLKLIKLGNPNDLSKKQGNVSAAIKYSFIGAMSPKAKESAYLHLPTYLGGLLYHIGTFLTLGLFVWFLINIALNITMPSIVAIAVQLTLYLSAVSGIAILLKRIFNAELRSLSGVDDYISNILTTLAQIATALFVANINNVAVYFILMALFFLWLPFGKTKHALYFFAARYHLGYFYGWRGTWPPQKGV